MAGNVNFQRSIGSRYNSRAHRAALRGWDDEAVPVINNKSGTFADGQTITINGSNFSTAANTRFFTDFSGDTIGQRASGLYYWSGGGADYLVESGSPQVGNGRYLRSNPIQDNFQPVHYEFSQDQSEIFAEFWCSADRIDFTSSPDAAQIKMFRFCPGTGESTLQGLPQAFNMILESTDSMACEARPNSITGFAPAGGFANATLTKFTMYKKIGEPYNKNGKQLVKMGSVNAFKYSGASLQSPTGQYADASWDCELQVTNDATTIGKFFRRISLPYFQRTQQTSDVKISQIYIQGGSQERVVIGDAATWDACDHSKTITAKTVSRSNSQIQFVAQQGYFTSGNVYAYVINHSGLRSAAIQVR